MRSDQTVVLTTDGSAAAYPDALRRVVYFDAVTGKRLKFLTNNFTLPALAGGTIFQVDQTAPADQEILRHQRERGEDPNLDRGLRLRARGYRPEEAETGSQPLPNSTDFERDAFRENAHFAGTSSIRLR